MQIQEIIGNIVDTPGGINIIFHQANVDKVMGAGVARALREKWPEVYKVDREQKRNHQGTFSEAYINENLSVYNIYAQSLFHNSYAGHPTSYDAAYAALMNARIHLSLKRKPIVIGIPKYMGCGLGGGNWKIYSTIIEVVFEETDFKIIYVEYK